MSRPPKISTELILDVARTHFLQHGHSASVHAIAKELAVSHSALLQRFGSKRALLIEAMRPPLHLPWPTHFNGGPSEQGQGAQAELKEICYGLHHFFQVHSPRCRVLLSAGVLPEEIFHEGVPLPLRAVKTLSDWIVRGVNKGVFSPCNARSLSAALVGSLISRVHLHSMGQLANEVSQPEEWLGEFDDLVGVFQKILEIE